MSGIAVSAVTRSRQANRRSAGPRTRARARAAPGPDSNEPEGHAPYQHQTSQNGDQEEPRRDATGSGSLEGHEGEVERQETPSPVEQYLAEIRGLLTGLQEKDLQEVFDSVQRQAIAAGRRPAEGAGEEQAPDELGGGASLVPREDPSILQGEKSLLRAARQQIRTAAGRELTPRSAFRCYPVAWIAAE